MSANYVSVDEFLAIVAWLRLQRDGSPQSRFSLLRVGFENPELIGVTFGAHDGVRRLNRFGLALASSVRRSDLVARDLSVFWVLLPDCNAGFVRDRLHQVVRTIDEAGLNIVNCHVMAHVFPHPEATEIEDARQLLGHFDVLQDLHGLGMILRRAGVA